MILLSIIFFNLYLFMRSSPLQSSTSASRIIFSAFCILMRVRWYPLPPSPSFWSQLTRLSQKFMNESVGLVAGMSILITSALGFASFFTLPRADPMKLNPFLSSAAITSATTGTCSRCPSSVYVGVPAVFEEKEIKIKLQISHFGPLSHAPPQFLPRHANVFTLASYFILL